MITQIPAVGFSKLVLQRLLGHVAPFQVVGFFSLVFVVVEGIHQTSHVAPLEVVVVIVMP